MIALFGLLAAVSFSDAPIVVDGALCHPRNLMVKYDRPATLATLERSVKVIREFPEINYAVVQAPIGRLQVLRKQLSKFGGVSRVDLDRCSLPTYDPNDQYWPDQWDMRAIRANYAWDTQRGDPSVIVGVVDTGVMTDHPDLAPNIWTNTGEIPGNGIDDDNDGYVDDVNGYDFSNNDGTPNDVYGHGTACSGLVAAAQDNTIGVSGVAPYCKIMALKASTDSGYFYDSNDVAAFLYAVAHGAKVLSMSFFSDRVSQSERDALDYCFSHGVLPVAAAGNAASVFPFYPGAYEHVLSVAAVDGNLNKAGFSNYGTWVSVSAPGVGLYTTTNSGGYTSGFAGTSGACPHVAGLAALCFSARLNATPAEVKAAIEDTATAQSQAPYGEFANYGLVNAELAVQRMNGGSDTPHPPVVRYVTQYVQNSSRTDSRHRSRIYGRGFGAPNSVQLFSGGAPVGVVARDRNWIDFNPVQAPSGIEVRVNGSTVNTIAFPATGSANMLAEASTQSATLTGGFAEALAADGLTIDCTRRSDGYIVVQGTFRLVENASAWRLVLRRQYSGTTVGTETVQLYDWSSGSYPYGNFVTVGSGPCPTSMTTESLVVSSPGRFIDPEGTVYLLITTSSDLPAGTVLHLDVARLER